MRDGVLVGFVPHIDGSEDFDEARSSTRSRAPTTTNRSPASARPHRPRPRLCPRRAASSAGSSGGFRER